MRLTELNRWRVSLNFCYPSFDVMNVWPSEITSFTPLRPHLTRPFKKPDQPFDKLRRRCLRGTDAEADNLAPTVARHDTAIIAAAETIRSPSRTFR